MVVQINQEDLVHDKLSANTVGGKPSTTLGSEYAASLRSQATPFKGIHSRAESSLVFQH